MIAASMGVLVVHQSHHRYRATRQQLDGLAGELGIAGFETTRAMRADAERPDGIAQVPSASVGSQ
jgi:hypothetical protein